MFRLYLFDMLYFSHSIRNWHKRQEGHSIFAVDKTKWPVDKQAKRYLVFKNPSYHDCLSEASKGTLVCQGGPMTKEEAEAFEALPSFAALSCHEGLGWQGEGPHPSCDEYEPWKEMARQLMT